MYNETENRWNENRTNGEGRQQRLRQRATEERHEKEELARRLSQEATAQLEKTIEGLFAFPAAVSLGVASAVMTFASFLARGFEVFTQASEDIRRDWRERSGSSAYDPGRGNEGAQQNEPNLPRA